MILIDLVLNLSGMKWKCKRYLEYIPRTSLVGSYIKQQITQITFVGFVNPLKMSSIQNV